MLLDIFQNKIILQSERVLLRPLEKEDVKYLIPFAINEPEIWRYSLNAPKDEASMIEYVNAAVTNREQKKEYPFIVFDKKTNTYVGCTRFYDIQPTYNTTQLGYTWYGSKYQKTGINRHCKLLLLSFAFEDWGVDRVEFRADSNNEKSIKAMQAIGCTVEGVLRNNMYNNEGGKRNSVVLSILRDEWYGAVKKLLQTKAY